MSIHAMTVTIGPGWGGTSFKATCSDPAADCHYICAEQCETWGAIVRNEVGAVIGHEVEGTGDTHLMEHVEECNYVGFLGNDYEPEDSMEGDGFSFTIPAEFIFHGYECVTWKATS